MMTVIVEYKDGTWKKYQGVKVMRITDHLEWGAEDGALYLNPDHVRAVFTQI